MVGNCRGRALRIVAGIMMITLLLVGGAGATKSINDKLAGTAPLLAHGMFHRRPAF
jgi:hypothetical protein